MIEINTVGAGGGSIAWIDSGGHLKVGPRSAGAAPGPVCYDLGNDEPTVTDANVVLQVLNPTHLLGGKMPIDAGLAQRAIEGLAARLGLDPVATAQGVVSVVTATMARAIRVISVQRGYDPRDFTLVAFGGAGPLHAARLARELEIPRVLVPERPGILCALGLLVTDLRTDYSLTRIMPVDEAALPAVNDAFCALDRRADAWFAQEGIAPDRQQRRRSIDMRYAGQNYELPVTVPDDTITIDTLDLLRDGFARTHQQMYGYSAADEPSQMVTFRLEAIGVAAKAELRASDDAGPDPRGACIGEREVYLPEASGAIACPLYDRDRLASGNLIVGPAVIDQMDSTTLILPDQGARVDRYRNLIIEAHLR